MSKIRVLLEQVDEAIAQDTCQKDTPRGIYTRHAL